MNNIILNHLIENEKNGKDYQYDERDRIVLQEMLAEINCLYYTDFQYLAELDSYNIKGAGAVVARYIKRFTSQSVRACLIAQMVYDGIKDCDRVLLDLYLDFKQSSQYISKPNQPSPAHIYARYDNAFKELKPKHLKDELVDLMHNPRDAHYLPFTIKLLSSWKIPRMRNLLMFYLAANTNVTADSVGIDNSSQNYYPSLDFIRKELQFSAICGLKYYYSDEVYFAVEKFLYDSNPDFVIAAKKTLAILDKTRKRQLL